MPEIIKPDVTKTNVEIDSKTGSLNYTYPLSLPNGRGKANPILSLNYSSQNNSNTSILGHGWSLGLPTISLANKYGTNNLYNPDKQVFVSSIDGEIVEESQGRYFPRSSSSLHRYVLSNNSWTLIAQDRTMYKFGEDPNSRQSKHTGDTFKWYLSEIEDSNGNKVTYEYHHESGQQYLKQIKYVFNASDALYEINLYREDRPDVMSSYNTAFLVKTQYRINRIEVKVADQVVREYLLTYSAGDNGVRSLLSHIEEVGYDEQGQVVRYPKTEFEYNDSNPGWTLNQSDWQAPTIFSNGYQGMYDVNGDSLPDIVESYPAWRDDGINTFLNQADQTWSNNENLSPPILFRENEVRGGAYGGAWDQGVRVGDLNGDLLPDIVRSEDNGHGRGGKQVFLNTGVSWSENNDWTPEITLNGDDNIHLWGAYLIDLNGDGLTDVLRRSGDTSLVNISEINNGTGFDAPTDAWNPPVSLARAYKTQLVDMNGDGLPDIVYMNWNTTTIHFDQHVYINTGDGNWLQDDSYVPPIGMELANLSWGFAKFFDINSDGLADMVPDFSMSTRNGDFNSHINTGSGWINSAQWNVPESVLIDFKGNPINVIDVNLDGSPDFFTTLNTQVYQTYVWENNTKTPVDYLSKITTSGGVTTDVTYKRSARYADAFGEIANPDLPHNLVVVDELITTEPVTGQTSQVSQSYEGGDYYYNDAHDRQFAGFNKVTSIDDIGRTSVKYYHQGNDTDSVRGEHNDEFSKIGYVYREELYDALGELKSLTITKWKGIEFTPGSERVVAESKVTKIFDDTDSRSIATEWVHDALGNVLEEISYGDVVSYDNGTFTDIGFDKRTVKQTYAAYGAGLLSGSPSSHIATQELIDQFGVTSSYSQFSYDNLSLGHVSEGNVTLAQSAIGDGRWSNTRNTYDNFGNLLTSTDSENNITKYVYDSYDLHPVSLENAAGHVTQTIYNYRCGAAQATIDPNGAENKKTYDGFCRVVKEEISDPNHIGNAQNATLAVVADYEYIDTRNAQAVHVNKYLNNSHSVKESSFLDGFGRIIQTRVDAWNNIDDAVVDTKYDSVGRTHQDSLPYFAPSSSTRTSPTSNTALYSTYSYDALDRIVSEANAVGSMTTQYTGWNVQVTDANNHVKRYTYDAYGNLTDVYKHNEGDIYHTKYAYDGLDSLIKITDGEGNVRNFKYNKLGLRTEAEDLHHPSDLTFGIYEYSYDTVGNTVSVLNPNGQTISYEYDELNRVASVATPENTTTYHYDDCDGALNSIGRLCQIERNDNYSETYKYNAAGGIHIHSRFIVTPGTSDIAQYDSTYSYDRQGNIVYQENPDGQFFVYDYGADGRISHIASRLSDNTLKEIIAGVQYAPHGSPSLIHYANNAISTFTYDQSRLYRLQNKTTVVPNLVIPEVSPPQANEEESEGSSSASSICELPPSAVNLPLTSETVLVSGEAVLTVVAEDARRVRLKIDGERYDMEQGDNSMYSHTINTTNQRLIDGLHEAEVLITGGEQRGRYQFMLGVQNGQYCPDLTGSAVKLKTTRVRTERSGGRKSAAGVISIEPQYHNAVPTEVTYTVNGQVIATQTAAPYILQYDTLQLADGEYELRLDEKFVGGVANTYTTILRVRNRGVIGDVVANIAGELPGSVEVFLNTPTTGARIYYTTDGSAPTTFSDRYRGAIVVTEETTLRAVATRTNYADSEELVIDIVEGGEVAVESVVLNPHGGTFTDNINVLATTSTTGAQIKYTFTPEGDSESVIHLYNTGIKIEESGLLKVWAEKDSLLDSDVVEAAYIINQTSSEPFAISSGTKLQDIIYTYDPAGNIINVVDNSDTSTAKNVTYVYDDLDRLVSTNAEYDNSNLSYQAQYTYSPIGNILSRSINSETTRYCYSGHTSGDCSVFTNTDSYANPHATLGVSTPADFLVYEYDKNGNVINDGARTLGFNSLNQLASIIQDGNAFLFTYDQSGQRLTEQFGLDASTYTVYPFRSFNINEQDKVVAHSFLGTEMVATFEGVSPSGTLQYYHHTDHLGGAGVAVREDNLGVELTDYLPYGAEHISLNPAEFDEQRKFTGHEYNNSYNLTYANARYYDQNIGRFISQDPAFLMIGDQDGFKDRYDRTVAFHITNPQNLNSYAYVNSNPLLTKDESGEILPIAAALGAAIWATIEAGLSIYDVYDVTSTLVDSNSTLGQKGVAVGGFAIGLVLPGGGYGKAGKTGLNKAIDRLPDNTVVCRGGGCKAENFLKGSHEYKSGLSPTLDTPLTGISTNAGENVDDLLQSGVLPQYGQYGQTSVGKIKSQGGVLDYIGDSTNPYHTNIDGLSANQLEDLFTPTQKNIHKIIR